MRRQVLAGRVPRTLERIEPVGERILLPLRIAIERISGLIGGADLVETARMIYRLPRTCWRATSPWMRRTGSGQVEAKLNEGEAPRLRTRQCKRAVCPIVTVMSLFS